MNGRFVSHSLEVNGRSFPCADYLPPGFDGSGRWPLVLYLHSSGERGHDNRQTHAGLGLALRRYPERWPCLVTLPQCPEGFWWADGRNLTEQPLPELAEAALDAAVARHPVDRRRIYLSGISMGGYGTWILGARWAERLAALAPICGGGRQRDYRSLATLPIWAFHGADDDAVPVAESRRMWDVVREAGGAIRYSEYRGVGHECWDRAYAEPDLPAWLLSQPLKS